MSSHRAPTQIVLDVVANLESWDYQLVSLEHWDESSKDLIGLVIRGAWLS